MSRHLTSGELDRYQREGILFPIQVLTTEEVSFYRAAVEDLEMRLGGRPKPSEMIAPQLHFRWAWDLATHPAVLDAAESVLGPDILVHSTAIFSKHPHTDDYVSWHQDGYYWEQDDPPLTSAWIALSVSTPENGCLRVVPGSHLERRPHTDALATGNNLLPRGLEIAVEVDESQALDVRLAPGQMSLHHVNTVHGSRPNGSPGKRIGFAVRYIAPQARQNVDHHDVILARGRDGYGHYRILADRPDGSIEQGLQAQAQLAARWRQARLGR